uniref:Uncharacterized protein n=1 Tax=Anguilla anguilla TaxID=7936 RepID=A0A0E9V4M7_ANGAN
MHMPPARFSCCRCCSW